MDTPDIFSQPPPPQGSPDADEVVVAIEQECQELRVLFMATLVALIFLALAANGFFYIQMRLVRQQVNEQRPIVWRTTDEFRTNRHPEISRFMAQLQVYAASHRDFQTNILDRYRAALPQYFNMPMPVQPVAPLAPGTNLLAPPFPGR